MKLKVNVIQISLKNNKVAGNGDIIDHTQLPVPGNWKNLISDGYLSHTNESKAAVKAEKKALKKAAVKAEKKALKKSDDLDNKDDDNELSQEIDLLSEKTVSELLEYAEKNEIEVNPKDKKPAIFKAIVDSLKAVNEDDELN